MGYERAIDHAAHYVAYAGTAEYVDAIPSSVRCERFAWRPGRPVVEQLRPWLRARPPFDRIIARHELLILPAARLRAEFGIPGMRPDEAERFRDKLVMKAVLARAGFQVPRNFPVTQLPERAPWPGRTIVKPRDANASQGVHLCEDYARACELIGSLLRADGTVAERYEVEEYVDGPIWQVDGFLFNGEPVAVETARYVNTCLDFEHGLPVGQVQDSNPELAGWAVDCLRALRGGTFPFHLEAIMTERGPVFLEVAARCGGGYTVEMFRRRAGIHLHPVTIAAEVDGRLPTHLMGDPPSTDFYAGFLYPGHRYGGAPVTVSVPRERLDSPLLITHQFYPPDTPTKTTANYRPENLPFSGLISGPAPAALEAWIRQLFRVVTVTPAELPRPVGSR
jgi:hypothetical protein